MKNRYPTFTTRAVLVLAVLISGVCWTTTADAQLRGFDRLNISRIGGMGGIGSRARSSSSTLDRVLPQVMRSAQVMRSTRGRNYSQPVPVTPQRRPCPTPAPTPAPMPVVDPVVTPVPAPPVAAEIPSIEETKATLARALVEKAKNAFAEQDYEQCADTVSEVLKLMPEDADAYQFRSLAYFALEDFEKSAADAYDSFRFGNAWTWSTLVSIYPAGKDARYTNQLRSLEKMSRSDAQTMSTHFLLAYHYIVLNHLPQAERELNKVLTISAEEPLSKQLLAVVQNAQQASKVSQK